MGIFRLFRHITKRYTNSLICYRKNGEIIDISTDSCLIDLNAVFHPCCQVMYEYGNGEKTKSVFWSNKKKDMTPEEMEIKAFNMICNKIDEIVRITKPKKFLYLAIDGVPGLSKQTQQRQRRFKSALSAKTSTCNKYGFDPNCITTGTEFMERLCSHLFGFIKRKKKYEWKHLQIIYNDMHCPGEGEHKIIRWLETEKNVESCTIVSPDADLIMLSLTLHKLKKIYIFRENIFDDFDAEYFFVDINTLRTGILNDIKYQSIEYPFEPKNVLKDYVVFNFLIGNDFLPHIHSLEITNQGIDILYTAYVDAVMDKGNLIEEKMKNIIFRKEAITELMKNLAGLELKMLLDKHGRGYAKYPDKLIQKHMIVTSQGTNIDFDNFRKDYYITKLHLQEEYLESEIRRVCKEYMIGILFIARYYFKGIPTFSWCYPFHYAPLVSDLYTYCKDSDLKFEFNIDRPLSMYESLLGIFPPSSFHLLPSSVREGLKGKLLMDVDFLEEFDVDLDGCQQEYEGKCILPLVGYDKLKYLFSMVKLTEEEKRKNSIGNIYKF
jgi:5'-3' exoribonuclease 2